MQDCYILKPGDYGYLWDDIEEGLYYFVFDGVETHGPMTEPEAIGLWRSIVQERLAKVLEKRKLSAKSQGFKGTPPPPPQPEPPLTPPPKLRGGGGGRFG